MYQNLAVGCVKFWENPTYKPLLVWIVRQNSRKLGELLSLDPESFIEKETLNDQTCLGFVAVRNRIFCNSKLCDRGK